MMGDFIQRQSIHTQKDQSQKEISSISSVRVPIENVRNNIKRIVNVIAVAKLVP